MTNYEGIKNISQQQRAECEKMYLAHPLSKYIDWKAFFASDDGNEMHFVKALDVYKDDNGKTNYVLERKLIKDIDYHLVYVAEDNEFIEVPV